MSVHITTGPENVHGLEIGICSNYSVNIEKEDGQKITTFKTLALEDSYKDKITLRLYDLKTPDPMINSLGTTVGPHALIEAENRINYLENLLKVLLVFSGGSIVLDSNDITRGQDYKLEFDRRLDPYMLLMKAESK